MAHARLIITLSLIFAAIVFTMLSVVSCNPQNGAGDDGKGTGGSGKTGPKTERLVIGGKTFDLELALDANARALGLMNRASIADNGGMLFVFPDSGVMRQSFWMKNCLVDIDIIYLDPRGKITAMHRMKAEAPRRSDETEAQYEARIGRNLYPSGYPAQFAIELKSGWLDQLNLKVEQQIELDIPRLKAMAR
jgi:hypothetical protein